MKLHLYWAFPVALGFLGGCSDKRVKLNDKTGAISVIEQSLRREEREILDRLLSAGAQERIEVLRRLDWVTASAADREMVLEISLLNSHVLARDCDAGSRAYFNSLVEAGLKTHLEFPDENAPVAFLHMLIGDLHPNWFPRNRAKATVASELARWRESDLYLFLISNREPQDPMLKEAIDHFQNMAEDIKARSAAKQSRHIKEILENLK